jgi:tetratricopeptide (TPR) repeat protein
VIDSINMLLQLSPTQFTKVVQQAFEAVRAQDLLALGESPLAEYDWLQACRLPSEIRSTEGDGRLVQALLWWLVDRLRPAGEPDHTVAAWQSYLILVEFYQNRRTVAKVAEQLTFSEQAFYPKRGRALQAAGQLLRQALLHPPATPALFAYTLAERYRNCNALQQLFLRWFSTFRQPLFLQEALFLFSEVAHAPQFKALTAANETTDILGHQVNALSANHLLQQTPGDGRSRLAFSANTVGQWLQLLNAADEQRQWHRQAATFWVKQADPCEAAWHYRQAGDMRTALTVLIEQQQHILEKGEGERLEVLLAAFLPSEVTTELWTQLKLLAGKVAELQHNPDRARLAYQQALLTATTAEKGQIFYRVAKLIEAQGIDEAVAYYGKAVELLEKEPTHPELLAHVYIDWAWIYLQARPQVAEAEEKLQAACAWLQKSQSEAADGWAAWHNAWGRLHHNKGEREQVFDQRFRARVSAVEAGDLAQQAKIAHNIGLEMREAGDFPRALRYLQEALTLANQLGDRKLEALCHKTIGGCYFGLHQYHQAIEHYNHSRDLLITLHQHYPQAFVCWDLAEVHALGNDQAAARFFFAEGLALTQALDLPELRQEYRQLADQYPWVASSDEQANDEARLAQLLQFLHAHESISNQEYRALVHISPRQAARDLAKWVAEERLLQVGKGRGVHYQLKAAEH